MPGDTVAVLGCGPIGQFAVQWAKVFGASRIIAVDIFEDKLALACELGATDTINSKECDPVERLHELVELGADAVLETAGSKFTQEQSLSMVKKHGHIVFIGISHGELPLSAKSAENILRRSHCAVLGIPIPHRILVERGMLHSILWEREMLSLSL